MTAADNSDPRPALRRPLVWVILALTAGSVLFRLLVLTGLNHTSLVFIGIPAVLAIITALYPAPTSATGLILRVITLALLFAGIVFGEALVCILMAAPLFFLVGTCLGLLVDFLRTRRQRRLDPKTMCWLLLLIAPAGLEGVVPGFEFERREAVTATRIVGAPAREIAAALARTPRFDADLPAFFSLGFPTPGAASGSGLEVGDRRAIEFRHGHHPGTLVLEIRQSEPGHVELAAIGDDSYITHWLSWQRADVRWIEVAPGQTLVSWTLEYRRRLDPAWYFAPLERYGARLAAGYLIDALAAPQVARLPARGERAMTRVADAFCRPFSIGVR